jgi:hypothetical protein
MFKHHCPDGKCASLALQMGGEAGIHVDPNCGTTYALSLGASNGGRLWIHDGSRSGRLVTTADTWTPFNAQQPHCPMSYPGMRVAFTFYAHRGAHRMSNDLKQQLIRLGVPVAIRRALKSDSDSVRGLPSATARSCGGDGRLEATCRCQWE